MSEKIEPALSEEEWEDVLRIVSVHGPDGLALAVGYEDCIGPNEEARAYSIAINNAALPDDDRRKITREMVNDLRRIDSEEYPPLSRIADALESYLPPETP